jgi:hypothetical protein
MSAFNVEAAVVARLNEAGVAAYATPPADRPERFATVEEVGRRSLAGGFIAVRSVAVTAWAPTLYQASALMDECEAAMASIDAPEVTGVEEGSRYRFPSEHGEPRYQASYDITVNV